MFLMLVMLAQSPPTTAPAASPIIFVVSATIAAIFGTGGIVALVSARRQNRKLDAETAKLRGEADVLPIDLAKGAVVVQADVIKDLREELLRQDRKIDEQAALIEKRELQHAEAAERADNAYRLLDAKCSDLSDRLFDIVTRFEAVARERDEWRTKAEEC